MKTKQCTDCNKRPCERGRTCCRACRRRRAASCDAPIPIEYKIGRFGFVFAKINGDWIRSALTPREVKNMTRLGA